MIICKYFFQVLHKNIETYRYHIQVKYTKQNLSHTNLKDDPLHPLNNL